MSNRHVPFICGVFSISVAAWLIFGFDGWWRYLIGGLLLAFGWISLKTAIWATDTEINELTTPGPVSRKTEERLKKRL